MRSVMTRSGVSAGDPVHGLRGAAGGDHAKAGPLEDAAVDLEEVVVVVDDQDESLVCHGSSPAVSGSAGGGDLQVAAARQLTTPLVVP